MQLFSRHRRNDEAQVARTWEGGGHRSGAWTGTAAPAGFAAPPTVRPPSIPDRGPVPELSAGGRRWRLNQELSSPRSGWAAELDVGADPPP